MEPRVDPSSSLSCRVDVDRIAPFGGRLHRVADMRTEVLLSLGRALWEQVTPDLRGVAVSHHGSREQGLVQARFLYEGQVNDLQAECVSLAETYCIADFPAAVSVAFRAVPHATLELLPGEEWVFLRWEPEV